MFIKVQQKDYFSSASATTHTVTFNTTPIRNNLLLLPIAADGVITTPTGWTQITGGVNYTDTELYYKIAGASEATSIVVTINASTALAASAIEYTGNLGVSPLDQTASNIGSGTTGVATWATGTTPATTVAKELVIGVWGQETATGQTASYSGGFTGITSGDTTNSVDNVSFYVAVLETATTGTQTCTITVQSTNAHWAALIATFKPTVWNPSLIDPYNPVM